MDTLDSKKKKQENNQKITPKQELFCKMYVSDECFGNATRAYAMAYNKDLDNKKEYLLSKNEWCVNLTKPYLLARINELLDNAGLNKQFADTQLLFVMKQHIDLSNKMSAIKEFNRIQERLDDRKTGYEPNSLKILLWEISGNSKDIVGRRDSLLEQDQK